MTGQNNQVLISIVTHNSKDIFAVLDNLQKEFQNDSQYQIVIYDNHSSPEYCQQLKSYEPFVEINFSQENSGFGYGHNQNLKNTQAEIAIILNPDVIVTKKTIDELVDLNRQHLEVAIVAPKILNADGTTQHLMRENLYLFDYFLRFQPSQWLKKKFSKRLERFECRNVPDDANSYVRMSSGCFMTIKTAVFKEIGGFDERFFMYFEDNDLCLRIEKANYKILYTPFQSVIHFYGKGSHRDFNLFKIFLSSMMKFFNKWGWRIF